MNVRKIIKKKTWNDGIVRKVQKMISHFENFNFISKYFQSPVLKYGFNTESLKQIIKNEWLLTNTIVCDHPAFLFQSLETDNDFRNAFEMIKGLVTSLPFSVIEVYDTNLEERTKLELEQISVVDILKNSFEISAGTILKNQMFCLPGSGVEFFHKQQRERKIWWRKFSALPGRFQITQVSSDDTDNSQSVNIQAEFPWGFETVESIRFFPERLVSDNFFEVKNNRKKFIPQIVSCETFLDRIALTYLCDAYEEINDNNSREILRFCRKLAPYKVSFAAYGSSSDVNQNLKDLAVLLAKKIRKCGISVLLLPDMYSNSLERQILRNDGMGIPYTILLNDRTLKDGIIDIRSRDTTLKEQSHVSLVVSYVEKLMKNY